MKVTRRRASEPDQPTRAAPDRFGAAGVVLAGAWLGMLTGIGEVSVQLAGIAAVGRPLRFDPNAVWMVPLVYTAVFGVLAGMLAAAGAFAAPLRSTRVTVTIFTLLGLWTAFLMHPRLHWLAVAVLAAGIAFQLGRFAAARQALFERVVRRSLPIGLSVFVLLGAGMAARNAWLEASRVGGLPAAAAGRPNVLLLILDTVRAVNLSAYGYVRPTTPNLKALAEEGARFERALATAPWTLPSHASMFTGRYPHETTADWMEPLDATHPTLAEALAARGYRTGGFVANRLFGTQEWGLERGFTRYEGYARSVGQALDNGTLTRKAIARASRLLSTYWMPGRKNAERMNDDLLDWLDGLEGDRPFFAFVNYYDAHEPYVEELPDRRFSEGEPLTRRIRTSQRHTAAEVAALRDAYDGAIAYLDDRLGRLVAELDRRGLRDNTLIIVTSDHGEEFDEHGHMSHGNSLYLPSLHVPLIMVLPSRVPAGAAVPEWVTLRDLPATVLHLIGESAEAEFPGRSLARRWLDSPGDAASPLLSEVSFVPNQPDWYPVARGDMQSIQEGALRYIRNGDGVEELYDLFADPGEQRNLAGEPAAAGVLDGLRAALRAAGR